MRSAGQIGCGRVCGFGVMLEKDALESAWPLSLGPKKGGKKGFPKSKRTTIDDPFLCSCDFSTVPRSSKR